MKAIASWKTSSLSFSMIQNGTISSVESCDINQRGLTLDKTMEPSLNQHHLHRIFLACLTFPSQPLHHNLLLV